MQAYILHLDYLLYARATSTPAFCVDCVSRGRIADNPNMKNMQISFSVWEYWKNSLSPLILRIDREEYASFKRQNFEL